MYMYTNRPERRGIKTFITVILTATITVLVMKYAPEIRLNEQVDNNENNVEKLAEVQTNNIQKQEQPKNVDFVNIVRENMPSVVGVSVLKPDGIGILDFNLTEKWGIGTGIILSKKGYILTNQHLASTVNGNVTITLDNGEEVKGKTIWNEENLDLAIVQIEAREDLKPVMLGTASNNQIGEDVIAIGNPLGLEFQKSVTKGVISGVNRTLKVEDNTSTVVMENLIQTDASINTGNSGGPLINKNGEVIGINTVKITSAEGIGFAVPIDIIKPILQKLEKNNSFIEAYLGIFGYDAEIVPYLDKTINTNNGIYVATVTRNGPAQKYGVRVGDIILSVNGVTVNKMMELREYIYGKEVNDKLELEILRNNDIERITVTLGQRK